MHIIEYTPHKTCNKCRSGRARGAGALEDGESRLHRSTVLVNALCSIHSFFTSPLPRDCPDMPIALYVHRATMCGGLGS